MCAGRWITPPPTPGELCSAGAATGICPVGSCGGGACAPTESLHTSCTNSYTSRALSSADEQFPHRVHLFGMLKVAFLSPRK